MPRPARGSVEIVKRKDGLRTFWLRVTVDGRRHRVRLGTDRDGWTGARAQVELEEQIKKVAAGTWALPEAPPGDDGDPTFRAFASSWLEDSMLEWRPSTIKDIRWRLESHLLPQVGEDRLSTFDIPRVTAIKTALLKESRRISELARSRRRGARRAQHAAVTAVQRVDQQMPGLAQPNTR